MLRNTLKLRFDYDCKADDFFAHTKQAKSLGSAVFGDLVLDYDANKALIGVQFTNATKFLAKITGTKDRARIRSLLENLRECTIEVLADDEILSVRVRLSSLLWEIAPIFTVPKDMLCPEIAYA